MLADRFGARPVFLAGLALFTAASLVAGLAPNGSLLIGMHATQGAGAALMGPAALAILVNSFAGSVRGLALGVCPASWPTRRPAGRCLAQFSPRTPAGGRSSS